MATPVNIELARGLTRCAVDCFEALECLTQKQLSSLSIGIIAGHCIEASMKAHLVQAGWGEGRLKKLGHDLLKCWHAAKSIGVDIETNPPKWVIGINYSHNRLRFRYPKSYDSPWLPHPEDYIDELSAILKPLVNDFLLMGGKYVEEF